MNEDINRPMNEHDRIRLLQMEAPYCVCLRSWIPLFVPAMKGYIRQCPTCPMSASYCICPEPEPQQQQPPQML